MGGRSVNRLFTSLLLNPVGGTLFVCEWQLFSTSLPDFCFAEAGDPLVLGLIWTLEALDLLSGRRRTPTDRCVFRVREPVYGPVTSWRGSLSQVLMDFMFLARPRQWLFFSKV